MALSVSPQKRSRCPVLEIHKGVFWEEIEPFSRLKLYGRTYWGAGVTPLNDDEKSRNIQPGAGVV